MNMNRQSQSDLAKAIGEIAKVMPLARTMQLYEFALFLQSHPLPAEESIEAIAADEKLWEQQFAATSDHKLAAIVATVEAEIDAGQTLPMFDEHGKLIEHR